VYRFANFVENITCQHSVNGNADHLHHDTDRIADNQALMKNSIERLYVIFLGKK